MKEKDTNIELPELFDPRMCVGTRLNQLSRVFTRFYANHYRELDITITQASIMFLIKNRQPMHQSQVGKLHHLQRSTVTRDLVRLVEKKKYVTKTPHPVSPILELTEEGEEFLKTVKTVWKKAQVEALEYLGEEGLAALNSLTTFIRE